MFEVVAMPDDKELRPVAVIVGGGGGIGQAIARQYANDGYRIVLVDRDAERLAAVGSALPGALALQADLTRDTDIQQIASEIQEQFGRIDLLVHAAGLTHVSLADETRIEVHRRVMEVNVFGVIALTGRLLPNLIRARGQIVVLSSICGFAPLVARSGYCASKHALHGYFDTLRCELAPRGVGVLIVCPSFVDTDFASRGLAGDGSTLTFERSTLGKPMSPRSIAHAVRRAANRRKGLLVLSWRGKLSYWLTRLFPSLYARWMVKSFQGELRRSRPGAPRSSPSPEN